MKRGLKPTASALLALAALVQPAWAGTLTPISKLDWEPNQLLEFRWREDAEPPAWLAAAISDAVDDSNASRSSRAPVLVRRNIASSWVAYTVDLPSPAALAYASRRVPDLFKIWLRPQGHVFDWGVLRWCQFFDAPPNGCFDAEMVALHEFGHVQGLGHVGDSEPGEWLDSIMHPTSPAKPKIGYDAHWYGPCDTASLQTRYELLSPATPVSKCLELETAMILTASASSVPTGNAVSFVATLRIAADIEHARLAGDPLSSRTVALQRRTPGTSTWYGAGLMSASTSSEGTYRIAASPGATYEWRAVFSQTNEGALSSVSPILKVSVTSGGCNPYCVE